MELLAKEKIAILYAIKCMMAADGIIDTKEMNLLNKICSMIHARQSEFDLALKLSHEDAMVIGNFYKLKH